MMNSQSRMLSGLMVLASSMMVMPTHAAGDPEAGRAQFGQCAACHAVGPGAKHQFGPMLNGVTARPAGSAEGYSYSDALKKAVDGGLTWDEATLDEFLKSPMTYLAGTKMAFPGLPDETRRQDMIAYLQGIDNDGEGAKPAAPEPVASADTAAEEPRPLAKDVPIPEHGVLHLGRPALPEEVAAWDIDIRPDGLGLPDGSGSVEDGGVIYDANCAVCHGVFGEGEGRWPILAGGFDSLTDDRPEKTIGSYWPYLSTVYDYVRRAMPFGNARSLSNDDVYALTAYLLYLNDQVDEDFTLSSENFTTITLPNVDNFIEDTRPEEPFYVTEGDPCMSDCKDSPAEVTMRARVLDVTPDAGGDDDDSAGAGAID